jgi:hypothetical protein
MFFDSTSGDRIYTSDAWAEIWAAVFTDGVMPIGTNPLQVTPQTPNAMGVYVNLGSGFVQGRFFQIYSVHELLALAASDPVNPRIDRVILRIDFSARTLALAAKAGTPAVTPVAPALQQDTIKWEISLAQVLVPAGATSISGGITDERAFATAAAVTAWGKIKVGASTILSTGADDLWEMVAGTGITLTPDVTNKKITVASAAPATVEFHAHSSSAQSIPGSLTKVLFQSLDYSTGTGYSTATSTFTAPVAGTYLLTFSLYFNGTGTGSYYVHLFINGVDAGQIARGDTEAAGGAGKMLTTFGWKLALSDAVTISVFTSQSSGTTVVGSATMDQTYLSGRLLP